MWDETLYAKKAYAPKSKYSKANSFLEISDWNEKHRYLNESIILPRISA